jgi:hypothetical protein
MNFSNFGFAAIAAPFVGLALTVVILGLLRGSRRPLRQESTPTVSARVMPASLSGPTRSTIPEVG